MIKAIIFFIWSCLTKYVARRCTGEFMDELFDSALTAFARATPSTVDDELVEKWKQKKQSNTQ